MIENCLFAHTVAAETNCLSDKIDAKNSGFWPALQQLKLIKIDDGKWWFFWPIL